MNKDFKIENNKTIIFTDNKGTVEREASNNIEEILVCENNIEEMERDIQYSLNHITLAHNKAWSNWSTIGAAVIWLASGIFTTIIGGPWWVCIIPFLGSVIFSRIAFNDIKKNLNYIKAEKCIIKELEDNLQNEKNKLNELNNNKTNSLIKQNRKTIYKSEEMYNLKRKLDIIYYYEINKANLIKYYKKGISTEILAKYFYLSYFDNSDLALLEELIKNDLNKNEEKTSSKQKVLEKK